MHTHAHTRTCRTAAVPIVVVAVVALLHARPYPVPTLAGRADRPLRHTARRARPTGLDRTGGGTPILHSGVRVPVIAFFALHRVSVATHLGARAGLLLTRVHTTVLSIKRNGVI